MVPTREELDEMAAATSTCTFNALSSNDARREVMKLCLSAKRNDILSDIVTTLDRIQNDTDTLAKVAWGI